MIESRNSRGRRRDFIQAVVDAGAAGVDILNLSVGISRNCSGTCSLCREIELTVSEDDVCVIAATGNKNSPSAKNGVVCPAPLDSVLGVGGYLPQCGNELIRTDDSQQWWIENGSLYGPYCGQRGCGPDSTCEEYRNEIEWPGNVSFHNAAPDVLAPVLEIHGSAVDDINYQSGTSFATPLVSGLLAAILGELTDDDIEPSVEDIRKAVRYNSTEMENGDYYKFDMERTYDHLSHECS